MTAELFNKITADAVLSADDLRQILLLDDAADLKKLFQCAYQTKLKYVGNQVYLRGIIEISNICGKDCFYCGIRRGNSAQQRFQLTHDEAMTAALWAYQRQYGSIVIQGGERHDAAFLSFITALIDDIKQKTDGKLGITLSLGEQNPEVYREWFDAGAHRYLLRIESSSPELYGKLHPPDHSWQQRLDCLQSLRSTGYQLGTGVMIGLPFQTIADLVRDLLFFRELDVDMVGMGPYLPHHETPLSASMPEFNNEQQLQLGLKMIAAARLLLKNVNIAATTALQALAHNGREQGLMAGANIIMPNITAVEYRSMYQLYDNKPCLDENSEQCKACLENRIKSIGETIAWNQWGDSPHFNHTKTR
jgi:biotin synthase